MRIRLNPKFLSTSLRVAAKYLKLSKNKLIIKGVIFIWKQIIGFENIYEINEYGDIRNSITKEIRSPYITNKGYKAIDLYKDGIRYKYLIHRLVAVHFVPNPDNYPIVLHKDNNKLNTYYTNLKWGTYSENNAQAISDGLNKIPTPDNRKRYSISNSDTGEYIICNGINEVINVLGFGNDSCVRNYIFRNTPIPRGEFRGYYIRKLIKPFTIDI